MGLSDEVIFAVDILRFLAMPKAEQAALLFGPEAPEWIRQLDPLRGALEEIGENSRFLLTPEIDSCEAGKQALRELDALVEILLWADDHHPSGKTYTTPPGALEREEWNLVRRLSEAALDGFQQPKMPFSGDWKMIFAR